MKFQNDPELLNYLHRIREYEVSLVVQRLVAYGFLKCKLLEIGAGTGYQAQLLAKLGYEVAAIDLQQSNYIKNRVYPIRDYDGKSIPYNDNSFDVVFSSNVLEHIHDSKDFELEIQRVLNKNGIVIHILPNATWRIVTSLAFYPDLLKKSILKLFRKLQNGDPANDSAAVRPIFSSRYLSKLIPARHGEKGNVITETWYFRMRRWQSHFERTGWVVRFAGDCELFYTGYSVLGARLSVGTRKKIGVVTGGVTSIFVLTRSSDA